MEPKEVFDELKTILVTRLKFDPRRAVDLTLETTLPKGIESSIGLDSLDFIELVDRDRGALRHRDGRVGRPGPSLHVLRHPVSLHRLEDSRRVKPVAVTGLGVVSPFGAGVKAYWEGITGGVSAIRPLTLIDTEGFRCRIGAEVPDSIGGSTRRSRADRFALAAAREALDDAGIGRAERADTALIVGAVGGGMLEAEAWYWQRARGVAGAAAAGTRRVLSRPPTSTSSAASSASADRARPW